MVTRDQPGHGWTVVLRRQPVRMVDGRAEGGYTDMFEIVCCDCGDDPDLDYSAVSPELRQVRGPYSVADGIAAYVAHVGRYHQPAPAGRTEPAPAAGRESAPAGRGQPGPGVTMERARMPADLR